jgi:hypothetical protein
MGQRFLDAFPVGRARAFCETVNLIFAAYSWLIVQAGPDEFISQVKYISVPSRQRRGAD